MTPLPTENDTPLYSVDYRRLALLLLPTFLRKSRLFSFCRSLVFGIETIHERFSQNRAANINRLQYNGQVCYLRKLLNDKLDIEQRRITITDEAQGGEWLFIYDEAELRQTFVHTLPGKGVKEVPILWDETKIEKEPVSFLVTSPDIDPKKLEKLLNEYKLIGQKYKHNLQKK